MTALLPKYEAVAIGCSAGGFEALSYIFQFLPQEIDIPIIIVQHLNPDDDSCFSDLMKRKSNIEVVEAEDKTPIRNLIYTAPANYHLLVEPNRRFSLSLDMPVSYSRPSIDVLFESASAIYKEKLIGVLLTGANRDGALGLAEIEARGGITIAQNPETADMPIMPEAGIKACKFTKVMNLEEIPRYLITKISEKELGGEV